MASEQVKTLMVYLFYGIVIGITAWLGYLTAKFSLKVDSNLGSIIGGIIGLLFSIFLWFKIGKKYVETTKAT
jgi:hypothetical protein